jgi:hypothetical protein
MKKFGSIILILFAFTASIFLLTKLPFVVFTISIIPTILFFIYLTVKIIFQWKFKDKISKDAPIANKGFFRRVLLLIFSTILSFFSFYLFSIGSFKNDLYFSAYIFGGVAGFGCIFCYYFLVLEVYMVIKILRTTE